MLIRIKNITIQESRAHPDVTSSGEPSSQSSPPSMSALTKRKVRTSKGRLDTNYTYQTLSAEVSGDPIRPLMAVSAVAAVSEKASSVINKPDSVVLPIYYAQKGAEGDILKEALIGRQRLSDVSVLVPVTAKVSALVTSLQDTGSGVDSDSPSGTSRAGLYVCALLVDEGVTKSDIKEATDLILDGSVLTPGGLLFSSLTVDGSLRALDSSKVVLDSVPTSTAVEGNAAAGLITGGPSSPNVPWYNTQVVYDSVVAVASVIGGVFALATGAGVPVGLGLLAVGVNRLIQSVASSIYDERTQGSLAVTFSPGRLVSDCVAFVSVFVPTLLPISGMAKVATVAGAMVLNRVAVAEDAPTISAAFGPAVALIDDIYQIWRVIPVVLIALIACAAGNRGHSIGSGGREGQKGRDLRKSIWGSGRASDEKKDPLRRFVLRRL